MADVHLARHTEEGRYVAIKVLSDRRAADPDSCALFHDEARVAGMLAHINIAAVHEVAEEGGVHYLAMDYIHGVDLREVARQAAGLGVAIPYACAASIVAAAAAGLDHAHRRCDASGRPLNLVHRDVSLSNIMIGHDGGVKVVDFGIAQSTASEHHTNPGIVRGKASYMAPEQCMGDPVDRRADVFALGVVLYELTTGRRCFQGDNDFDRMFAVVRGTWLPPSVHIPEFPLSLERVIRTALALDPAHRYQSAAAMLEDLEAISALEGWQLGSRATAGLMCELFGHVPFPHDDGHDRTQLTRLPSVHVEAPEPVSPPTVARRRFARGSIVDLDPALADTAIAVSGAVEAMCHDVLDDTPTRGRPSAARLWAPHAA
jgi:serine/threonine-protein kinase